MISSSVISLFQILVGMLCAAAAFGVLLTTMLVRGNFQRLKQPEDRGEGEETSVQASLFDLVYTDKTYLLASIMASIGACVSIRQDWGVAVMFMGIAVSFQIAEHWLLPRMRLAAQKGLPMPMMGTRARFEILQSACLLFVFGNLAMPPLITLVRVYGL